MMLLPIVVRELQAASRRRATYRMRFYLVLTVLGIGLFLLLFGQRSVLAARQGQVLFRAMGILALVFCLLAGAFFTADCLSEEKREGTLGLLFLTDLRGYDVVLGKLIATSLHAFYGLLAVLPVLGLPLLMGSVGFWEFARLALALVTTLFVSLSVGMLVSALWLRNRQTMTLALVLLLVLAGLPLVLTSVLWSWCPSPAWRLLAACSPVYLFRAGFEVNYPAAAFWTSFGTLLGLGCAALVFPCFYAPRAWREGVDEAPTAAPATERRRLSVGPATAQRRRRWLEQNPFYWLAARDRMPQWTALLLLGPLFSLWCCFLASAWLSSGVQREQWMGVGVLTTYVMHQVLKYLVTAEAARRLSEDKRSGTLELMLVTPLAIEDILAGHRRALSSLFLWPAALVLATNAGLWTFATFEAGAAGKTELAIFLFVVSVGGAAVLFFDLQALSMAAMWLSVKTGRQRRAVLGALARVMLGPWLALAGLVLIRGDPTVAAETFICWLGVSALIDASVVNWARPGLLGGLRDAPAEALETESPPASEPAPPEAAPESPVTQL